MVTEIHSERDFEREVVEKKGFTLLACKAAWCRYCKVMLPTVEAAAEDFKGQMQLPPPQVQFWVLPPLPHL